jgi:endo-1,4-beta-xylanase
MPNFICFTSLTKPKTILTLIIVLTIALSGCSKKDSTITPPPPPPPPPPPVVETRILKDQAKFPIGAAVTVSHLNEADFASAFKGSYNQLSAEYEMKMNQIWTSLTGYNWTNADFLVNYATQNSMKVHGHALLWYQSFPDWFKTAAYDTVTLESNVKTYIQTVVTRYKGKIVSWDVANEIFADDGTLRVESTINGRFKDPIAFYGRCFQYARNADPNVKLFYNDYDQVLNGAKRSAMKNMVIRFKSLGYPIDGIGDQFHTTVWTSKSTISSGLTDIATTGLLVHISELDIRVNPNKLDSYIFSDAEQQGLSDMYKSVVESFESIPQAQKFAITTWGVTDKYTWLTGWWHPKVYPLLFDSSYAKKKAYTGFLNGLK